MKLNIEFTSLEQSYTLVVTIYHKKTCILRTDYQYFYTGTTRLDAIKELQSKLNDLCMYCKPLELFSDNSIHHGSSLSLSFAHNAFMYAHTIMPSSGQEVTTSNIFPLHSDEVIQFYCELHKLWLLLDVIK
jgi:hypothetical protein